MEVVTEIDKTYAKIYYSWIHTIYLLNIHKAAIDMQDVIDNMTGDELQELVKQSEKNSPN